MIYVLSASLGYLIGSIPFGLVLCKMKGLGDIREIGSGNIGATNVLRTGNKGLALATLLLDSGKGAIAVLVIPFIFTSLNLIDMYDAGYCANADTGEIIPCGNLIEVKPGQTRSLAMIAGFFALVGHCYPVWLKFKGGKGVATTLGTLIALKPLLGLIACGLWLLMALSFRVSSMAALVAVGVTPLIAHYLYADPNLSGLCAMVAALVYLKHRENIKRLFAGQEPKINFKKNKKK